MCAQYNISVTPEQVAKILGSVPGIHTQAWLDRRVYPYTQGPVIVMDDNGQLLLESMNFSLVPAWAQPGRHLTKAGKYKWPTYNARLETIHEKPSFRTPFKSKRCIVLMSDFIEPIYKGEFAQNMVSFSRTDSGLLLAAGIWDTHETEGKGYMDSYSIITYEPSEFVEEIGHDRQPVFLSESNAKVWVNPSETSGESLRKFLINLRASHEFEAKVDRPLKN
jgi:putative SOS response-associated peptidase YedK